MTLLNLEVVDELSMLHRFDVQQDVQYVSFVLPPIVTQKFLHSSEQLRSSDQAV